MTEKTIVKIICIIFLSIFLFATLQAVVSGIQYRKDLYERLLSDIHTKNWIEAKSKIDNLGAYKDCETLSKTVNFNYYITIGDEKFTQKDYNTALNSYKEAQNINPNNKNIEDKIKNTEPLVARQELEKKYREIQKEQLKKLSLIKSKIEKSAIHPIPTAYGKGYDKTINRYGIANIKKINALMPKAAELIAENPNCEKVLDVDVSDVKSTKNSIVIYVDCGNFENFSNFERFYVSENDINNKKQQTSIREQMKKNKGLYLTACEAELKSRLTHPSTFKTNVILNQAVDVGSFQTTVRIDFKAKNSFNLETSNMGLCRYNSNNQLIDVSITEK